MDRSKEQRRSESLAVRRRWKRLGCGLVGAALLGLCGCGSSSGDTQGLLARESALSQTTFAGPLPAPDGGAPTFDVTITDGARMRALYEATLALPPMPAGTYNCPADFGVTYELTFGLGADGDVSASLEPSGCGLAHLIGPGLSATRWTATSPGYWPLVAQSIGVDESAIYPYTPPP